LKTIAVIGASGFVGTHYYERAIQQGHNQVIPVIHSSGNAWRLTRSGAHMRTANLLSKEEIANAIAGCSHVVNCSRGSDDVMIKGLSNLLEVCAEHKIEGFVHLSSVMVYGDPPSADSLTETGTPMPHLSEYGTIKFKQDQMVMEAANNLPSAILCPPNITGPYSPYLINLLNTIQNGEFALLEQGEAPCVVVDVDNLCHAIDQALDHCSATPQRLFITDDEPITWRMLTDSLMELVEFSDLKTITEDELRTLHNGSKPSEPSLFRSLKHLVSSEVREALRKDPMLTKLDILVRKGVAKLGSNLEDKLRLSIEGTPPVPKLPQSPPLKTQLVAQQLRGVRHSCETAKRTIGYQPPRSFSESMAAFSRWNRSHQGMDSDNWSLIQRLKDV